MSHTWKFFRTGGFDQVRIDTTAEQLTELIWSAVMPRDRVAQRLDALGVRSALVSSMVTTGSFLCTPP